MDGTEQIRLTNQMRAIFHLIGARAMRLHSIYCSKGIEGSEVCVSQKPYGILSTMSGF